MNYIGTRFKRSFLMILVLVPVLSYAQGPGFDDDVEDTPFDGGIMLIAIAAGAYGVKRLSDRKIE